MPNAKGWATKEEVLETGLPYYIPSSRRWTETPYPFSILLSKSRCNEFKIPVMSNDQEKPVAYRYAAAAGTGTSDNKHRFIPLYERTHIFTSGELDINLVFSFEKMGIPDDNRSPHL